MMRLWLESYGKTSAVSQSALVSVIAHAALIAAAVTGTQKAAGVAESTLANRVYYIPPPNRAVGQRGSRETLRYFELAPEGLGAGLGAPRIEGRKQFTEIEPAPVGDMGTELKSSVSAPATVGSDSVLSILEVDSVATRDATSAAPAYPITMLKQNIQGSVFTQYVVDTSGFADSTSLRIVRATHEDFALAVRAAIPYMRFAPARLGQRKVRQLVEQEFSFKIQQSAAADSATKPSKPIP
jgi:protein TonB